MARERHPVPGHEQRPRCRDDRIAGGISTVEPPLVGASAGSTGRGPGKPLQPGDRTSGRIVERHLAPADAHRSDPRRAGFLEDRDGRVPFSGTPPGDGSHHLQCRLILLPTGGTRQPFEPRGRLERPAALEGLKRGKHRGSPTGWRVEPTTGHLHDRDGITRSDRFFEEPIRAGAELQFVSRPTCGRQRPEEAVRLGLDAPPGALAPWRTEEKIAIATEDLVDERGRIAPAFIGDQAADAVELSFFESIGGERHATVTPTLADIIGRRVGIAGARRLVLGGGLFSLRLLILLLLGEDRKRPRTGAETDDEDEHHQRK